MKKLSILFTLFIFITGTVSVLAQTDSLEEQSEEIKKECPFAKTKKGDVTCKKSSKECSTKCKNKSNKTCCDKKGKKTKWWNKKKESSETTTHNCERIEKGQECLPDHSCCKKEEEKEKEKACCSKKDSSKTSDKKKREEAAKIRLAIQNGEITPEEGRKKLIKLREDSE